MLFCTCAIACTESHSLERLAYVTADASATPPPVPPMAPSDAEGSLELRIMLAKSPSADAPEIIRIIPAWGGANRGAARATGWTSVPLLAEARSGVVLHAGDESVPVAGGSLSAGRWDRVFIAVESVDAPDAGAIESHIEPIALGFNAAPNSEQVIELELLILDRPSRPGYWRIFVKDARNRDIPRLSVR